MSTIYLATDGLCHLGKLCGMFSSNHAGERAAAAAKADAFVRAHGLTWAQVIMPRSAPATPSEPTTNGEIVAWLLERSELVSAKESDFLHNIVGRSDRLSVLQQDWLDGLYSRVKAKTEGAYA